MEGEEEIVPFEEKEEIVPESEMNLRSIEQEGNDGATL